MFKSIDLSGIWNFQLDEKMQGANAPFNDTITLPGTTSFYKKGKKNENVEIKYLTDEYKFEGYAWFSRTIEILDDVSSKNCFLYLERTRVTTIWIDGVKVGTQNSILTPHIYDVTNYLTSGEHTITILVDNVNIPVFYSHLTEPSTQTNWNGITGKIELQIFNKAYLSDVQVYSNIEDKSITIKSNVIGADKGIISASVVSFNSKNEHKVKEKEFTFRSNEISINYSLGESALLWSEYEPNLYKLNLNLIINGSTIDTMEINFGLREFKTQGKKFTINGTKTFLRGKHDSLNFPLTGFTPTTVEEWLNVLKISKSYGMNYYRFHTCCPPEAAFVAADILGIYMQPELIFCYGGATDEHDENHDADKQKYIIREGFSMLKNFGNHPSFVMMSLGNEIWGSTDVLNTILKLYKDYDNRHLYTQGSNNFQFYPMVLENDDFFTGVRLSQDGRYLRGSFSMCDTPLGHIQTDKPSTMKDYDENICPTVKVTDNSYQLYPEVPIISHEIGEYATYPDFNEIKKYTGPLKPRNFETFKQRLQEKGLGNLAEKYFKCSGKLAVACYKEELESAFRSRKLGGLQLLDLQDYSGQGTALIGILDAFMEPKGIVSPEEWRSFCSDAVLMARFSKYNYVAEESFDAHIELCYYRNIPLNNIKLLWELRDSNTLYENGEIYVSDISNENYIDICDISVKMPSVTLMKKLTLSIKIEGIDVLKSYDLWVYPKNISIDKTGLNIFDNLSEKAIGLLENGENVVLFPKFDTLKNSIEGFYCADFWCFSMFRSICENENKKIPVGTMGLLIDNTHPIFKDFSSEEYSTYQWWSIVSNSRSIILDDTSKDFRPIVQSIDNFERNHKLGLMFECNVLKGKLLVCACNFEKIVNEPEGKQFLFSILNYIRSEEFMPSAEIRVSDLKNILN